MVWPSAGFPRLCNLVAPDRPRPEIDRSACSLFGDFGCRLPPRDAPRRIVFVHDFHRLLREPVQAVSLGFVYGCVLALTPRVVRSPARSVGAGKTPPANIPSAACPTPACPTLACPTPACPTPAPVSAVAGHDQFVRGASKGSVVRALRPSSALPFLVASTAVCSSSSQAIASISFCRVVES
jgi:hypothetical protein